MAVKKEEGRKEGRKEQFGEKNEVPLCRASTDDTAASPAVFTAPCQSAHTVLVALGCMNRQF